MRDYFVVGDIHGCFEYSKLLLTKWNPDNQQLIFLGDYIDRGTQSLEVLQLVMKLQKDYGAIAIGGNHENLLLDWLKGEDLGIYYLNGGLNTVLSFMKNKNLDLANTELVRAYIQEKYPNEIQFIQELPDYYESEQHIFVHAGVDFEENHWKNCDQDIFRWIRDEFFFGYNNTGKQIVFGHTPTWKIPGTNEHFNKYVWISNCHTKIGIDGGAVFGGRLNGLEIRENGEYVIHSVNKDLEITTEQMYMRGDSDEQKIS